MFQKKQIIYSETLGVCVVDNIVSLAASKREKAVPYYVLKPVFEDKVSYIPVEHHRVVLRDMFTREEALKLKETEQYEKDKDLRQAVEKETKNQNYLIYKITTRRTGLHGTAACNTQICAGNQGLR